MPRTEKIYSDHTGRRGQLKSVTRWKRSLLKKLKLN